MLTAIVCAAIPVLVVVTGRVDYALTRRAGIKEYGLDEYERKYEETDKLLAVLLGLFFPIAWSLALLYGGWWLLGAAITGRPRRSRLEMEQTVQRLERQLGYRDYDPRR